MVVISTNQYSSTNNHDTVKLIVSFTQNQMCILMLTIFKNIYTKDPLIIDLVFHENLAILQYAQNIEPFTSVDLPS